MIKNSRQGIEPIVDEKKGLYLVSSSNNLQTLKNKIPHLFQGFNFKRKCEHVLTLRNQVFKEWLAKILIKCHHLNFTCFNIDATRTLLPPLFLNSQEILLAIQFF